MSPVVVDRCLVVTVDLRPGVRVACAWSGTGPFVTCHAVSGGGFGMAVESWCVWSDALNRPRIEPTLEALTSFVLEQLAESDADGVLADLVEDVAAWSEERTVDIRDGADAALAAR